MRRLSITRIAPVVATCALLACVGPAGPTGATGPAGADGSLRVYGDGSAGSMTISTSTSWTGAPPNAAYNYQFADLTITAGTNLIVPSGLVIRVSGTFTNNGTIFVQTYSAGGPIGLFNSVGPGTVQRDAGIGINRSPAAFGAQAMGSGTSLPGGMGGQGVFSPTIAAFILRPGPAGGGGGSYGSGGHGGSVYGTNPAEASNGNPGISSSGAGWTPPRCSEWLSGRAGGEICQRIAMNQGTLHDLPQARGERVRPV